MKIKTQFSVLIVLIVLLPLLCMISIPVYHYVTSPQRYLMKGFRNVQRLGEFNLSENDMNALRVMLAQVPPNVQTMVFYRSTVLISTIPELKAGTVIAPFDLFDFIRSTSDSYDYQFQSPQGGRRRMGMLRSDQRGQYLMVISRAKKPDIKRRRSLTRLLLPGFVVLAGVESFIVILIVLVSRNIFHSIAFLERTTQRIAAGEIDTKIETPDPGRNANEILSLAESLEKMRSSLKDNQERRSRFIMGVSHDLRTPVALIKGYTEALSDGVVSDPGTVSKSLDIIHAKADQLETMINALIDYVKLDNTEWLSILERVDIAAVLRDFAHSMEVTGEVYRRSVRTSVSVQDGCMVPMDKALFLRVLENLFGNAVRYTKDGDTISFVAEQHADAITISISDTGIGIAQKDLEHLYDIFYRGTNSRREAGLGIGLSVVKTIVDSHGWHIDVHSVLDKGTSFTITIPLEEKTERA